MAGLTANNRITRYPLGSIANFGPRGICLMRFAPSLLIAPSLCLFLLAGCGFQPGQPTGPAGPSAAISGSIHGGQQPVSSATVQLIAPGTSGYGSAGSIIATAMTDANGNFTLPQPYTCPANSGLVYLQSTGGNAGGGLNNAINLVAIVGDCSALQSTDFFSINEVTTVAAAYALAPFADVSSGTASIGTSSTNLKGLVNAGATAGALANVHTGLARAANELNGVQLPTDEVNLLADILAACVNDGASGNTTGNCTALFPLVTPSGATAPKDTFAAAIQIALHPGVNTTPLFLLASAIAPFPTTIASAPNDYALGILFNGAGIAQSYGGPNGIDIDANGNAWVGVYALPASALFGLSPGGVYLNGAGGQAVTGLQQPQDVAITTAGNILVSDRSSNIYQATPGGSSSVLASGLSLPVGLAIDGSDSSIWSANVGGGNASHLSSTGSSVAGSPYTTGSFPAGVAVDGSRNVWVTNSDFFDSGSPTSSLTLLKFQGGAHSATNISTGAGSLPYAVAVDNAGNAWVGLANSIGKYSNAGAQVSPSGGYVTDSNDPAHTSTNGLQIDGLGRVVVSLGPSSSSSTFGSVAMFAADGTYLSKATGGYGYALNGAVPAYNLTPRNLAIDGSGNVWISGQSANQHGGQAVIEIVGMAAPVVTPLSSAVASNKVGVRP